MGGIGLHRAQQGRDHARQRADQHPHDRGGAPAAASAAISTPRRHASTRATGSRPTDVTPLKEEDAYPADPEDGYGWEKLYSERQCRHYFEDYGLETRVVRFHNIFGPLGTYDGGREKSPAAICRKIALASGRRRDRGVGRRRADALLLLHRRLRRGHLSADAVRLSGAAEPGAGPADLHQRAGGHRRRASRASDIGKRHNLSAPQGVRGRNSDNTRLREVLGWEPAVSLEDGLATTYRWIEQQLEAKPEPRVTAALSSS